MALFNSEENIVNALKQELSPLCEELREGFKAIQSGIESIGARIKALEEENTKLKASVSLKQHQLEEEAETKASQKAAEILAGMGHKAVADKPEEEEEKPSLLEQYSDLTGEAQRKFYADHKDELMKLCK